MSLRDDAVTHGTKPGMATAAPTSAWAPRLERGADRGTLITGGTTDDHPDWATIFAHWNLDPEAWEVDEATLRVNAWEGPTADGARIFRQYKAEIRRRGRWADVDPLLARIAKFKPAKRADGDGSSFVSVWADWQVGPKPDEFVERFEFSLAAVDQLARRSGADHAVILFAGDMREGLNASYPSQDFHATLDNTEQGRLVRACEAKVIRTLAPRFTSTTAAAVAGNHGRKGGEIRTRRADNYDLDDFEHVAEVITAEGSAEACGVTFVVPGHDDSGVLVDASGTTILLAHGDEKRGHADQLRRWWKDTAFTSTNGAHAAHMLVTGHRHHLRVEELAENRWLVVAPTLGPASDWYSAVGGGTSLPGTLCFTTARARWWAMHVC